MVQYTAANLLVHPVKDADDPGLILSITPDSAGWEYISFQARRLQRGERWSFQTGENELRVVGHRRAERRFRRGRARALPAAGY
jgi:5-deoxy-D-glucuronate isomerase